MADEKNTSEEFAQEELSYVKKVKDLWDPTGGLPPEVIGDSYISTATANGWLNRAVYTWDGTSWGSGVVYLSGIRVFVEDKATVFSKGSDWEPEDTVNLFITDLYSSDERGSDTAGEGYGTINRPYKTAQKSIDEGVARGYSAIAVHLDASFDTSESITIPAGEHVILVGQASGPFPLTIHFNVITLENGVTLRLNNIGANSIVLDSATSGDVAIEDGYIADLSGINHADIDVVLSNVACPVSKLPATWYGNGLDIDSAGWNPFSKDPTDDEHLATKNYVDTSSSKAGTVAPGSFAGNPKKYTVTFNTAFADANYSISILGSDIRAWSFESKTAAGFTINAGSNPPLSADVDWTATAHYDP